MSTSPQSRKPAGSPAGGQFAPSARPESGLDLSHAGNIPAEGVDESGRAVPHPAARMPAGDARPADLMSVVRAGMPDHEDDAPAPLSRAQVRTLLSRHLPGLNSDELDAHLTEIEAGAARLEEVESADPDVLDPGTLDQATAYPISLDKVREQYNNDAEALAAWREELRDYWASYTQACLHTAWTHSVYRRELARPVAR